MRINLCFIMVNIRYLWVFLSIIVSFNAFAKNKQIACSATNTNIYRIKSELIIDLNSNTILHAKNGSKHLHPASLTKMMTVYMIFDAVKKNKISLNDYLIASQNACNMRPLKLDLVSGEKITYRDAVNALIIKSANDVAVAVAENLGGTESNFANNMTQKAKELKMHNTIFKNASGWHHYDQRTTALDLARLAMRLYKDFPEFYHIFSQKSFVFKGKEIKGHNRIVEYYPGAEGMKTGFVGASGFNLVTIASRKGKRLLGVVTGFNNSKDRDIKMAALLDKGFSKCGVNDGSFHPFIQKNTKKNSNILTQVNSVPKFALAKKSKIKKSRL